jgi:hypothetical protein
MLESSLSRSSAIPSVRTSEAHAGRQLRDCGAMRKRLEFLSAWR